MKKRLVIVVLALLLATGACAEEVLPQLTFSWWGGEDVTLATQDVIKFFRRDNRSHNVQTLAYPERDAYLHEMERRAALHKMDDIMQLDVEMLRTYAMDEDGQYRFADLELFSDVLDLTQFPYLALESATIKGRLCAVPTGMTAHIFIWNRAALQRLNISLPESSSELLDIGLQMQESDTYPLAADAGGRLAFMITYLQSKYGASWFDPDSKEFGFTNAQIEDGFMYLQQMENAHVWPPLSRQGDILAGWQEGRYLGVWAWDVVATELDLLTPREDRLHYIAQLNDWGPYVGGFRKAQYYFAVAESSPYKPFGVTLIQFLLNSDRSARALTDLRGIPVSESGYTSAYASTMLDGVRLAANAAAMAWGGHIMPGSFEAPMLIEKGGVYEQVLLGLENEKLEPGSAAAALMSGMRIASE